MIKSITRILNVRNLLIIAIYLFFKNNNHKDLSKKLKTFIFSEKIRKNFIKKGYLRSKFFTWSICAKKTKKLYEKLVK